MLLQNAIAGDDLELSCGVASFSKGLLRAVGLLSRETSFVRTLRQPAVGRHVALSRREVAPISRPLEAVGPTPLAVPPALPQDQNAWVAMRLAIRTALVFGVPLVILALAVLTLLPVMSR